MPSFMPAWSVNPFVRDSFRLSAYSVVLLSTVNASEIDNRLDKDISTTESARKYASMVVVALEIKKCK